MSENINFYHCCFYELTFSLQVMFSKSLIKLDLVNLFIIKNVSPNF